MSGRLKALFLLAWALIRTLLRRLLGRGRNGLRDFQKNYVGDGLAPVSADHRSQMSGYGRCIACGLCDRGEAGRIESSSGAYPGLMQLILAASRSMPDFGAAAVSFSFVPEDVLRDKEAICPTGVPFRAIARFVQQKAAEARLSAAPGRGPGAPPRTLTDRPLGDGPVPPATPAAKRRTADPGL